MSIDFGRNIGDEPAEGENGVSQEEPPLQKIVIYQLIQFLEGLL
jgi:hypothetical protein